MFFSVKIAVTAQGKFRHLFRIVFVSAQVFLINTGFLLCNTCYPHISVDSWAGLTFLFMPSLHQSGLTFLFMPSLRQSWLTFLFMPSLRQSAHLALE